VGVEGMNDHTIFENLYLNISILLQAKCLQAKQLKKTFKKVPLFAALGYSLESL